MRLSSKELKAITSAFSLCLQKAEYRLYLFGSRVDDSKRGGDIDLLIIVPANFKTTLVELKGKIRSQIFSFIPEQKIDITVASDEEIQTDPFLQSVMPDALLLSQQPPSKS